MYLDVGLRLATGEVPALNGGAASVLSASWLDLTNPPPVIPNQSPITPQPGSARDMGEGDQLYAHVLTTIAAAAAGVGTTGEVRIVAIPDTVAARTAVPGVAATDLFTLAAHGLLTGTPVVVSAFGAGPIVITGIVTAQTVFVIRIDANTFKLATTLALALAGTGADITTGGTLTITYVPEVLGTTGPRPIEMLLAGNIQAIALRPLLNQSVLAGGSTGTNPGAATNLTTPINRYLFVQYLSSAAITLWALTIDLVEGIPDSKNFYPTAILVT